MKQRLVLSCSIEWAILMDSRAGCGRPGTQGGGNSLWPLHLASGDSALAISRVRPATLEANTHSMAI
jgi:hypothetical protein